MLQMQVDRAYYLAQAGGRSEAFSDPLELEPHASTLPVSATTARFYEALAESAAVRADARRWMQVAVSQYESLELGESVATTREWLQEHPQ